MFERATLQGFVDDLVTVPHSVTVLSPYSFELAPSTANGTVRYRVLVERVAFELRARVDTGYMAVGLRSAVVAGASTNPHRVHVLERELEGLGWTPFVSLASDSFQLAARLYEATDRPDVELMESAAAASCHISEFVLDQLLITRPYGEMRPAVIRQIAEERDESDPWLYDPSERDRSSAVHRALENWLIGRLRELGLHPMDPAGEPFFDVAWAVDDTLFVCEVKSTVNSEVHQLRLATGQILHYLAQLATSHQGALRGAILVSGPPSDDLWVRLLEGLEITAFWPDRWPQVQEELTRLPYAGVPT